MSDLAVRFGHLPTEAGREPAMAIYPVRGGRRPPMFAIPLSSAYKYADPAYLMRASFGIAERLQMHPDQFLVNRIAGLILDNLDDLVKQRPAGPAPGRAFAEGELRVGGERIEQFEAHTNGVILK